MKFSGFDALPSGNIVSCSFVWAIYIGRCRLSFMSLNPPPPNIAGTIIRGNLDLIEFSLRSKPIHIIDALRTH